MNKSLEELMPGNEYIQFEANLHGLTYQEVYDKYYLIALNTRADIMLRAFRLEPENNKSESNPTHS